MMAVTPRQYVWLANVVILGMLIWSAVSMSMSVIGHRLESRPGVARSGDTSRTDQPRLKSLSQYEAMANRSLFGGQLSAAVSPGKTQVPTGQTTPVGDTDLRLKGTIVQGGGGYAVAILEDVKTKQQDLYRRGDRIGSTELVQVERGLVTLRQGSKDVQLKIFEGDPTKDGGGRPSEAGHPGPAGPGMPGAKPPGPAPGGEPIGRETGPNQYVISREALGRHMGDFNYFLSNVNIQPYFADGSARGFKVTSVNPAGPVYQLGLRAGDVILSVNGVSVSNPEDLVNLYRQVQQLENVTVELERQGKSTTLSYSMR